eukprot:7613-Heterococcus_DN1.PRE.3
MYAAIKHCADEYWCQQLAIHYTTASLSSVHERLTPRTHACVCTSIVYTFTCSHAHLGMLYAAMRLLHCVLEARTLQTSDLQDGGDGQVLEEHACNIKHCILVSTLVDAAVVAL